MRHQHVLHHVSRPDNRRDQCALMAHGTQEQKATYLPKMTTGEWSGTMCLTEPHCGTDLGLMKSKAEPLPDGTYAISGQKIFISAASMI